MHVNKIGNGPWPEVSATETTLQVGGFTCDMDALVGAEEISITLYYDGEDITTTTTSYHAAYIRVPGRKTIIVENGDKTTSTTLEPVNMDRAELTLFPLLTQPTTLIR